MSLLAEMTVATPTDHELTAPETYDANPRRPQQKHKTHVEALLSRSTLPAVPCWMERWPEIEARIATRPRLLLTLGFDGILSPRTASPDEATLPEGTRSLLTKLGASSRISLAFVSGRPVRDIQDGSD